MAPYKSLLHELFLWLVIPPGFNIFLKFVHCKMKPGLFISTNFDIQDVPICGKLYYRYHNMYIDIGFSNAH